MIDPSASDDVVASKVHVRCEQLLVNAATGGWLPRFFAGIATFLENSDVLPAAFVAVAVTLWPRPAAGTNTRAAPEPSATADARYCDPEPKAPGARSATKSSTVHDAHVVAST